MLTIGLSPAFMPPDDSRAVFGKKTLTYMESDMAKYVSDMGAIPVLLPDFSKETLRSIMKNLDGLVLQGGTDISPKTYKESGIENNRWPGDKYRDEVELRILDIAFELKLPVLGICRGFQLINVYLGGSLYQDLETQVSPKTEHRNADKYDRIHHPVLIEKDSLLSGLYDDESIEVNTVHHQGIKDLGKDLIKEATCSEAKVIEAFKLDSKDHFVYGVQWHPEFFHTINDKLNSHQPLTDFFLKKVKEYKNENN
tara:strand:+ start:340 stop:1101 length:762 start_codon:yes stop_codon:yes gene_type:complete